MSLQITFKRLFHKNIQLYLLVSILIGIDFQNYTVLFSADNRIGERERERERERKIRSSCFHKCCLLSLLIGFNKRHLRQHFAEEKNNLINFQICQTLLRYTVKNLVNLILPRTNYSKISVRHILDAK